MMTGAPGVFAGGDMVRAVRTATTGVGDGRNAALHIDAWMRGTPVTTKLAAELAGFDKLHTWYYPRIPRTERPERIAAERILDFSEVVESLEEPEARREAGRCLSCGDCFDCESCRDVCPEDAIIVAGSDIDVEKCTTCKLCIKECPCGAIALGPR
jgi:ferredoxin